MAYIVFTHRSRMLLWIHSKEHVSTIISITSSHLWLVNWINTPPALPLNRPKAQQTHIIHESTESSHVTTVVQRLRCTISYRFDLLILDRNVCEELEIGPLCLYDRECYWKDAYVLLSGEERFPANFDHWYVIHDVLVFS